MSDIQEAPETEETMAEKPGPKLVWSNPEMSTGGPTGGDGWLMNIPYRTVFLARRRADKADWEYTEWTHGGWRDNVALLIKNGSTRGATLHWVDPIRFSAQWVHIMNVIEYPQE